MKILIVMKNWLGDILFQIPALEAIQKRYPEAEIVCMAPLRCSEILKGHPAIDRVIVFDEKKEHRSIFSRMRFLSALRKEKWDKGFLFHRSRTRAILLWLAGVKERIGYQAKRRFFLTHAITEPEGLIHQTDYFLELLRRAGFTDLPDERYCFCFTDEDQESGKRFLQEHQLHRFICFHLGANWEPKRWPPAHFAHLADLIAEKWGLRVVLTGTGQDEILLQEFMKHIKKAGIVSLVGKTNLGELGAIFQQALFVVSGDSGPMHIASGVGTRVVALFGPTDPSITGPRGIGESAVLSYVPEGYQVPWYGKKIPKGGWLSNITPEQVINEIEKRQWHLPAVSGIRTDRILVHPLKGERKTAPPQILIVTLSNLGDVILTTPVMMRLKALFPQAQLTVVTSEKASGILKGSCVLEKIVVYDKKASWIEKWKFLRKLREKRYDLVVDLRNTAIPILVNAGKKSPFFRKFKQVAYRNRHLEILDQMKIPSVAIEPFDFYSLREEESALEKIRNKGVLSREGFIVIAPVAASELKTWPLEEYGKVIRQLLAERNEQILLVGDQREGAIAEPLVAIDPGRIFNMAGKITIRETASLIRKASLVISNDSAIMHLGFELDRPVVAIFGPTDPKRYGRTGPRFKIVHENALCIPCRKPRCRLDRQVCFEDLSAAKVIQACRELSYASAC
ncbi:MAG: lipopolysaccharide heptosyltransferase II [Candidatus Omnitrophica bacterium]|nr:lipopolysaccharide heptosyltransferase II [Candidatus Omnitrophota bacterium]